MASVDRRIVEARFDNKGFQKGVDDTLRSVSDLNNGLKLEGAADGLAGVDAAAQDLGNRGLGNAGLLGGIAAVSAKFQALQIVGITALVNLTNKAVAAGTQMAKSLTIEPISQGFAEYELKLGSIQTIMAGSGESLDVVNSKLDELNTYADRTIYSFADMTTNIGKFTNSGVDLDTAVASIQGVANVAAVSGANAGEASRAMYNFAQALSKGYVQLIDWKSIELANMGTTEFKDQLLQAAEAQGILTKEADGYVTSEGTYVEANKNFNDSLTDQWLTTEVLNSTLGDYADETTDIGKKAFAAAQDVKTFTQLLDTVQEAVGSGWAQTFEILVGNFDEAKELFTNINDVVSGFVEGSAEARNKVLGDWKALGGRTILIKGITNIFQGLGSIVNVVKEAFREFFPPATGRSLYQMTTKFYNFTQTFKIGAERLTSLKSIFAGVFAILRLGWNVLSGVVSFFGELIGLIFSGSGTILDFGANAGDLAVKFYDLIDGGKKINEFFDGLIAKIKPAIEQFKEWVTVLKDSVHIEMPSGDRIREFFQPVLDIGSQLRDVWDEVKTAFEEFKTSFGGFGEEIATAAGGVGEAFEGSAGAAGDTAESFGINLGGLAAVMGGGGFLAFLLSVKGVLDAIKENLKTDHVGDLIESLTGPLDALTDSLKTMQNTLRAATLLLIAGAVGILAASVVALSKIEADKLQTSLAGVGALLAGVMAAMLGFKLVGGTSGLISTATGLVIFSASILVLAAAVRSLGELGWDELFVGLAGMAALIALMVTTVKLLGDEEKAMLQVGGGLLLMSGGIAILVDAVARLSDLGWEEVSKGLLAIGSLLIALGIFTKVKDIDKAGAMDGAGLLLAAYAIKVLAETVKVFADMDIESLAKGVGAVSALLLAFALFSRISDAGGVIQTAVALAIAAGSLYLLAIVMEKFAAFNWEEIQRGLAAMAGSLLAVAVAMRIMPKNMLANAIGMVAVGAALLLIADALGTMGDMTWEQVAVGLVAMAGALLIIAIAVNAMSGALAGAFAILVVAGALALLVPVLGALVALGLVGIGIALLGLAGVFLVLGLAGYALAPIVPVLMGIGAALALIGAGALLAGLGVLAFGIGLTYLVAVGAGAAAVVKSMGEAIISLIPLLATALGEGLRNFLIIISTMGPQILTAFSTVIGGFLDAVTENIPKILQLVRTLVTEVLTTLETLIPQFADTGLKIILGLLESFQENVPKIIRTAADLMLTMLEEIEHYIPQFAEQAADMIVSLIEGIDDNMGDVIDAAVDLVVNFIEEIGDGADDIITAGSDMIQDLIEGIGDEADEVVDSGVDTVISFIEGLGENALKLANAAADVLVDFLDGMATAIDNNSDRIRRAGGRIASSLISGVTGGLTDSLSLSNVASAAAGVASRAYEAAKDKLGIESPSKEFYKLGAWSAEGMAIGISENSPLVEDAAGESGSRAIEAMRDSLSNLGQLIDSDLQLNPVVTPIIDMTEIRRGVSELDASFGRDPLYRAQQVSAAYRNSLDVDSDILTPAGVNVTYNQTNNSPKALSSAEIYRQTQNQLSLTREVVKPNAS